MEFKYKAINNKGAIITGLFEADDENSVISFLKQKKLDIISIKPHKKIFSSSGKVKNSELILFTKIFSQLIKSGVPIIKSLNIIKSTIKNNYFKNIINELIYSISRGTSLSDALKKYPSVFSKFYCAAVEAGENSGKPGEVLEHIYNYLYKANELKKNIISALIYPAIIISTAFMVLLGIILFLVPQFQTLFQQFYTDLPFITRAVLFMNRFLEKNLIYIFIIITGFLFSALFYFRTQKGKLLKDKLMLKIPLISTIVKENIYAKMSRIIGVLFENNVDILKSLSLSEDLVSNRIFKEKISLILEDIKSGAKVSNAFESSGVFSDIIIQMCRIGEETGSFSEMFLTSAKYYEESLEMKSKILLSVIQPVLIVFTGIIIMLILIAIFIPIFQLSDLIK